MKRVILAIENEKLEKRIKENKEINIICNNLQYREAILELLEKNSQIESILISESLPGVISIEELIKKIKIMNNKINIIVLLEKENKDKKNKLKKLKVKNIYSNKKVKINEILSIINNNVENIRRKEEKIEKTSVKTIEKFIIKLKEFKNNKINKDLNSKIITIVGNKRTGKSTIIDLLLINLLNKNKKILLINLNKKTENNYLNLFGKKYYKKNKNNYLNNKKIKNIFLKSEIKIKNNFIFLKNFEDIIQKNKINILKYFFKYYIKKYSYILFDIGNLANKEIKEKVLKESNKILVIINDTSLGIREIQELNEKIKHLKGEKKQSLHIVVNKYYFNSVSYLILKQFFHNNIKMTTIFYNRKFKNLDKKILKNKKLKNNLFLKNKLNNIMEIN